MRFGESLDSDPLLTNGRAQTFGGRAVEVAEDPRVVRGQQSLDALLVEPLEQPLGRLAQRGGLADEHGHRLPHAPGPEQGAADRVVAVRREAREVSPERRPVVPKRLLDGRDRKSTRLNSSHSQISYAVFCLKKKTTHHCCDVLGNDRLPDTLRTVEQQRRRAGSADVIITACLRLLLWLSVLAAREELWHLDL